MPHLLAYFAAIDDALTDVLARSHGTLSALHEAILRSSPAAAARAYDSPGSVREVFAAGARAGLLSSAAALIVATLAVQVRRGGVG